jgi:hypothetical protein
MGPLSYMQTVVDPIVVMRHIPSILLPHDDGVYTVPGRNIVSPHLTVQYVMGQILFRPSQ